MPIQVKPLEYSEQTLGKRLKSIRLINIQGSRNIKIDLPQSGIIRLNAPSEVGKSSIFRPFEAMVTSKYNTKQDIESLVSKGETYGELILEQWNGTFVALHLDTTNINKCCYGIQYPGKPLEKLHYPSALPTILDALGWYSTGTGDKLDFSLNVQLKGLLPIVDTPKRLNTEIFNIALNDETLESSYTKIKSACAEAELSLNALENTLSGAQFALDQLRIEDTTPLKEELELLTLLDAQDTCAEELTRQITQVFTTYQRKPARAVAPKQVVTMISDYELLNNLGNNLNKLSSLQKPMLINIPKSTRDNVDFFGNLSRLQQSLTVILDTPKPERKELSKDTIGNIGTLSNFYRMGDQLEKLLTMEKPRVVNFEKQEVRETLNSYTVSNSVAVGLTKIESTLAGKPQHNPLSTTYDKLILTLDHLINCENMCKHHLTILHDIHTEMSKYQCPTCGQYYDKKHMHTKTL